MFDEPGSPTYDLALDLENLCEEWDGIPLRTTAIRASLEQHGALATARKYGAGSHDEGMKIALEAFEGNWDKTIEGLIVGSHRDHFTEEEVAARSSQAEGS